MGDEEVDILKRELREEKIKISDQDLRRALRHTGYRVYTSAELNAAIPLLYNEPGPVFVDVKITAVDQPMTLPPRDGPTLKHRFRENLLGSI